MSRMPMLSSPFLIGFDEIDTDRDGSIGFDEFHAWWID